MKTITRVWIVLAIVAVFVAVRIFISTRESASHQARYDLHRIMLAYHSFHGDEGRGPKDKAEFVTWAKKMDPAVAPLLDSPDWTIFYGADPAKMPAGPGNTVLAHGPTTDSTVIVGMGDGSTQLMTPAAFAKTTKAEPAK